MILQLNKVSKSFGTDEILNDITFSVNDGGRIGIIGKTGAEKPLCSTSFLEVRVLKARVKRQRIRA